MNGKLYVVGTPIGNLEDITLRQIRILKENADFIAAEDTRVTRKLLNHYDIKKEVISYHQYSTENVLQSIIARLLGGESCAIVTDAGMPCISDPGEPLVKECREREISIEVIPGPSAAIAALAVSGQDTSRFTFEGFLPMNRKKRTAQLNQLRCEMRTMIFYEAPHKLVRTLDDMILYFGEERKISICRELTKIHEEVKIMTIADAAEYYKENTPKGEFVLVVSGKEEEKQAQITPKEAVEMVKLRIEQGEKASAACKAVAAETGIHKNMLYEALHK